MNILPAYVCAWYWKRPEEGIGSPGIELKTAMSYHVDVRIFEKAVFLTAETSLQTFDFCI